METNQQGGEQGGEQGFEPSHGQGAAFEWRDGEYHTARANTWRFAETTQKKTVALEITFGVLDGAGTTHWITKELYLKPEDPKNSLRAVQSLRYCGFKGTSLRELFNGGGGLDSQECTIQVSIEDDERGSRVRVGWINALGSGGTLKPIGAHALEAFAAQFDHYLAQVGPNGEDLQAALQAPAGNPNARQSPGIGQTAPQQAPARSPAAGPPAQSRPASVGANGGNGGGFAPRAPTGAAPGAKRIPF